MFHGGAVEVEVLREWGFFCGAIYYPLFGAWTWGGGWLSQLGNNAGLGLG